MYRRYKDLINPFGHPRGEFHLDHIYSIYESLKPGHKIPVNIWEVCHPANLRMIPARENLRKNLHKAISSKELRRRITRWNESFMDPYFIEHHPVFKEVEEIIGAYDPFEKEFGDLPKGGYYHTGNCA
jgi:hypothetical protein